MMATVLRKVKLGNKNKSETRSDFGESENEDRERRRRKVNYSGDNVVPCGRVCGLVNVCTGPADSMGSRRRRNRPQNTRNSHNHLTLFQSLQLRIDLWTSTTGHLIDRSFARKFCSRKPDNELYRSNSFRFERFDKQEEDQQQQVSLCDDYSLPVDYVNKRKLDLGLDSRHRQQIDVVENYFDPKDSKVFSDFEKKLDKNCARRKRHSNPVDTASLSKELRNNLRVSTAEDLGSDDRHQIDRKPSPYYYSDLFQQDDLGPSAFKSYRKPEIKSAEALYSQSTKQVPETSKELESYKPFSAKGNFEPKQGGLEFYDFASGRVRKKHREVEVKKNLSKKKYPNIQEKKNEEEEEVEETENNFRPHQFPEVTDKKDLIKRENDTNTNHKEYVKSFSFDNPCGEQKSLQKKNYKKSTSLDISLEDIPCKELGENSNKFRPIFPEKETEEGIEGGDEEEEEVKKSQKKSLKKLSQYNYNYRDCLTGAPRKSLVSNEEFSPTQILQHVISSGGDSKSLLAACLAEWDAHARLMRPLTARTLSQCACAIGAHQHCVSSDEDDDYHYSRSPLPLTPITGKNLSQDSIRRRDFFKEPIPEGKNLGDEFIKGKKIISKTDDDIQTFTAENTASLKSNKALNAREIFRNWGIVVDEKNGFRTFDSDSAEAYRIAKEILEDTENWDLDCKNGLLKQGCRSTESLYDFENMSRRGLLYETAFDCKISRSDDDLEELERVTNHPVLHSRIGRSKSAINAPLIESYSRPPRPGSSFSKAHSSSTKDNSSNYSASPKEEKKEEIVTITNCVENIALVQTPSPPSTAPLPSKFCGHEDFTMNSIKSTPDLPTSPPQTRLKDNRLPIKSLRLRESRPPSLLMNFTHPVNGEKTCEPSEESLNGDFENFHKERMVVKKPQNIVQNPGLILEIKGRPDTGVEKKLKVPRPRSLIGPVLGHRRPGRLKYSSTESMATSSSGGSLESIKSSTSEGNRSTSSSESHKSSSLSSHSSDSVGNVVAITTANLQFHLQQTNPHQNQNNKMRILSPISDKSSVEPASETSDNNKNNNSQKPSPEDQEQINETQQHLPAKQDLKTKRRALQNKNLINLGIPASSSSNENQGSDSGISVDSRTPRSSGISANQTETDFSDLPFDMPKLRRRRLLEQDSGPNRRLTEADACTSSSANSVDLRDLPFDMPKLRRRLRPSTFSESQASSSQSVSEPSGGLLFRPSMTLSLDLESSAIQNRGLSLDLERERGCGTMTLGAFSGVDLIDPSLPLEKQTWYHGAITRVEAETLLRTLREGSYLVRNSESARQDYSLSLKSAKGFMHMRIQMDKSGQFILGQFSKPFDSIPDMIRHYSINRLPIRGAEHMCLIKPVAAQLL